MRLRAFGELGLTTYQQWRQDGAIRLGAGLAFYTVLSLVPLFVFATAFAARVFGQKTEPMLREIDATFGRPLGDVFARMLRESPEPFFGTLGWILSLAVLLYGAFQAFGDLEAALNVIYKVKPKQTAGFFRTLRARFLSLQMVLGTLFFLFVSLLGPLALAAVADRLAEVLGVGPVVWKVVHDVVVFLIVTLLLVLVYKGMPDARLAWSDVGVGAGLTALLFLVGKYLLSAYLRGESLTAGYGLARALLVVLVWVYYSCQLLLLGAEFTCAYANRHGSGVHPDAHTTRRA